MCRGMITHKNNIFYIFYSPPFFTKITKNLLSTKQSEYDFSDILSLDSHLDTQIRNHIIYIL